METQPTPVVPAEKASQQWIMREGGRDCFIAGYLNAGHVRFQDWGDNGRYIAVSHCSPTFLYGRETRYFESQDEAYEWVATMWAEYESRWRSADMLS